MADAAEQEAELRVLGRRRRADLKRIVADHERTGLQANVTATEAALEQYEAGVASAR